MKKGFTLIELLVVLAIIGILAAMIIASLSGARARARDATRKNDLAQVKTALEAYMNDNDAYPSDTSWSSLENTLERAGLMKDVPSYGPQGSGDTYSYTPVGTPATDYYMCATLEKPSQTGMSIWLVTPDVSKEAASCAAP